MLRSSFRLFTVAGIEVGIHVSWLLIFLLVTWSLAVGYFPIVLPEASGLEAWVLGAVASVLLFAAVLVHELAHSFVARWQGLPARSITLFVFGGVSSLGGEAKSPRTEFLIAVVGPLASLVVAALAFVASLLVREPRAVAIAEYLAFINVALAVFNLLPAFPLDGGRVLRSVVWRVTGSLARATSIAAALGRLAAWGFLAFGVLRIIGGDLIGGLWIAILGWFLHNAAFVSQQQLELELRLRGLRVRDIISMDGTSVPPDLPVAELIERYLLGQNRRAVPVADDGRLVGMVSVSDIRGIPDEDRDRIPVREVMTGPDGPLVSVRADDDVRHAIELLSEGDFEQLPVVEDGRLVGCLTRADVIRQLELRRALEVEPSVGRARGPSAAGGRAAP